ncbi:PEPxxWA-CTERM sorting domain-containing protein [Polymorphobacter megasporae]|uniref:PEPxxWA-CTERM sorting domain-containing protein n=1 Tax=Glacieibacterium megasporae TaxID=2835787 RepID=UPI001C1E82F3|nr:PEPxxWA-CTERM sorting domain-containing protein [Polymorphobacter megasporae]UAJ09240.1 PEPxxWA-CTERM sorting domain-containing protein [Polymorphobacter megasporae]
MAALKNARGAVISLALLTSPFAANAALYPVTVTPIALGAAVYNQDFDTLAKTGTSALLPAGFQAFEGSGTQANATYVAGNGSDNGGGIYSFGAAGSSDRALGSIRSGNLGQAFYGAFFTNTQATAVESLAIGYTGEQWRNGASSSDSLTFEYSLNATAINNGSWTNVAGLTFTSLVSSPVGALNGNSAADRKNLTAVLSGLSIASGSTFAFRWVDQPVSSGAQDGLAVDDFSVKSTVATIAAVPEPASWAMMVGGFGLLGSAMRRRQRSVVAA